MTRQHSAVPWAVQILLAVGIWLVCSSASAEEKKSTPAAAKVETLDFDAQQVEGRLRSPQILYFLRRVRAQFAPRPLGHRSFLLELADTRRSTALR